MVEKIVTISRVDKHNISSYACRNQGVASTVAVRGCNALPFHSERVRRTSIIFIPERIVESVLTAQSATCGQFGVTLFLRAVFEQILARRNYIVAVRAFHIPNLLRGVLSRGDNNISLKSLCIFVVS